MGGGSQPTDGPARKTSSDQVSIVIVANDVPSAQLRRGSATSAEQVMPGRGCVLRAVPSPYADRV
jgi:hypothetical protein